MDNERDDMPNKIELRGMANRSWIEVADAVVQAAGGGLSRIDLVNEVMDRWAKDKVHESTIVMRVTRGNGSRSDSERSPHGVTGKVTGFPPKDAA